jgi:hypothetical protein
MLPPIGGLLLAISAALAAPPAGTDTMSLRVEVYGFARIHVLTLRSRIEETGNRYAIFTDYATAGIAGWVVNLATHVQVEGRLSGALAEPERFRKDTRRNGVEHHDRIDYHSDGSVDGDANPPPPNPVPAAAARGTVDNLTAYFLLERQLARTGSCALAVKIFDGAYRYDLVFADAGPNVSPPEGAQRFSSTPIACQMTRRFPPGFPEPEQDEGAKEGTIWYARLLPGDVMVPVQMRLDTQLGVVEGFLAELHGRGVDLNLME